MKIYFLLSVMLMSFMIMSCEKSKIEAKQNEPLVSFKVDYIKPDEGYSSTVKEFSNRRVNSYWRENNDKTVQIIREITFDVLLENDKKIEFGYWFMKVNEEKELLLLENEDLGVSERYWDYKDFEDERINFYENYDEARILIDYNVVFYSNSDNDFKMKDIELMMLDESEKSFGKIEFQGSARGFYDPQGTINQYVITNGIVKGLLE